MNILKTKTIVLITVLIFTISSQGSYVIPVLSYNKSQPISRRTRAVTVESSEGLAAELEEFLEAQLAELSEGVIALEANLALTQQAAMDQADGLERLIIDALGSDWGQLSEEQQAELIWVCEELIESGIALNVKASEYGAATLNDVATPILKGILDNVSGIVSSLESLCGETINLNSSAGMAVLAPWLIIAMEHQSRNQTTAVEAVESTAALIAQVQEAGLDFDLTSAYEVGEAVAYVNLLDVAETLGAGYEGLAGNVVLWSILYNVPQDYALGLAEGAIANQDTVKNALAAIGVADVIPWLNVAMDKAIREDLSVEQAIEDTLKIIELVQGEGASVIAANISEELGRDFDWANSSDVALMAAGIEAKLVLEAIVDSTEFQKVFSLSPKTFGLIRDVLALVYVGLNLSNYASGTSSLAHAAVDSALLYAVVRPIMDMAILIVQRSAQSLTIEDGTSLDMGDEPKKSFYAQMFGRLPEWIQGNVRFLEETWWPRSSINALYSGITGAASTDSAVEPLASAGARTVSNILKMAYVPPLFGMYILNRIAGSAAGTLSPASPVLGTVLLGLSVFAGIITLGKLVGPVVSMRSTFEDKSLTGLIAGLADSAIELGVSTIMLMPMIYYLPMFHLRAMRDLRQQRLEGRVPERTPGWLINARWTLTNGIAESYRIQAPTVALGAAIGIGLGVFNPAAALLSLPVWGSLLLAPLMAYFSEPKI